MGSSDEELDEGQTAAEKLRVLRSKKRGRKSSNEYRFWKFSRERLREYTRERAIEGPYDRHSSYFAEERVKYAEARVKCLKDREPRPALEDFVPNKVFASDGEANSMLREAQSRLDAALVQWEVREAERRRELKDAQHLLKEAVKRKRATRIEEQLAKWPAHVILDPEYEIDPYGDLTREIEWQVDHECRSLEDRVGALSGLLEKGLKNLSPIASDVQCDIDSKDPEHVVQRAEVALVGMRMGIEHEPQVRMAYLRDSRQLVVEYVLPDVSVVPKAKSYRYVKNKDQVVETVRPTSQIKTLYTNVIAQLTLLCLATVFANDAEGAVDVIAFNGVVDTLDPRTGQPIRPCLITVRTTRDSFAALNLNHVDPQACLKHLSAGVSKSPTELAPVKPVLEFSMVDPRFVDAVDAIGTMDDRPNLLELKFTEFEALIHNLFTKMGLEARQTRPSRDGGVDCIAYDTRPIFGGKIVIQAKRYKNTVGVSAVRDLYGTLQNEGASKGILVTTSGYGAASFEFAKNKPIELIEGANLLYLLETYAGIKARIEPPDDWKDPEPEHLDVY